MAMSDRYIALRKHPESYGEDSITLTFEQLDDILLQIIKKWNDMMCL